MLVKIVIDDDQNVPKNNLKKDLCDWIWHFWGPNWYIFL